MKLCIFIALVACLVFYSIVSTSNPHLETLGSGEYCFYSTDSISSRYITKKTDLGFAFIYYCTSSDAPKLRGFFTHIDGESISLAALSVSKILCALQYKEVSRMDNIIYAYSPRGKDFISANGNRINLQIAIESDSFIVGWPVILGSY